jgi:colicin import membrane protein
MTHQDISTSRAFQFSLLVHTVFAVIIALSWNHAPKIEAVKVSLWSAQDVKAQRSEEESSPSNSSNSSATTPPAQTHTPPAPTITAALPFMKEMIRPTPPKTTPPPTHRAPSTKAAPKNLPKATSTPITQLTKQLSDFWKSNVLHEKADIQLEAKSSKKRKKHHTPITKKSEPSAEQHEVEHLAPAKKAEKKFILDKKPQRLEPKPVRHPLAEEKINKRLAHSTAKSTAHPDRARDDKADEIENMMDSSAPAHRAKSESAEEGDAPAPVKASHSGGGNGRGVDCSKLGGFCNRIRNKINGNLEWSGEDVPGTAVFEVRLFPSGEIRSLHRLKSSGNTEYDRAVESAIQSSSPLPRPDDSSALPDNLLILKYRMK